MVAAFIGCIKIEPKPEFSDYTVRYKYTTMSSCALDNNFLACLFCSSWEDSTAIIQIWNLSNFECHATLRTKDVSVICALRNGGFVLASSCVYVYRPNTAGNEECIDPYLLSTSVAVCHTSDGIIEMAELPDDQLLY